MSDPEEYDDFEEGDEEMDEEEEEMNAKKQRSSAARFFLDEEAEVDESEEEEDLQEEGAEGFVDTEPIAEPADRSIYRTSLLKTGKSPEEIAREIEDHYRYTYANDEGYEEDDYEGVSAIKQQSLLPSVRDPKLWMVKCKVGKERITVVQILQKYLNKINDNDKLQIKSVVSPDHLKGYIYIEAEKEVHVKNAIKGFRNIIQWDIRLVPIREMKDVLTVTKKVTSMQKGDWVRIKRGLYRGDLAQVYESDIARSRVTVKLIPRLDFSNPLPLKETDPKRKRKTRVPPRFFNPDELSQKESSQLDRRLDPHTKEPFYVFGGAKYKDGYLLKTMNIRSLDTNNVVPTLDELQKFQNTPNKEEQSELGAPMNIDLKPKRKAAFVKGDTVKVIDGDLKHLMGVVESVEGDTVNIIPKNVELQDVLSFHANQLQKHFKMGDHVKVISGRYEGETGLIVRIEENTVVLFSDLSSKEIKVLAYDIQECSDVTSGKVQLGNYELHDLVSINPQTVGVIVKVERDSFRVLDNNGILQTVSLQDIGNKRNTKDASTFDANQNPIAIGDMVKVIDGQHKGRQGTVKYIFKYFVFLHSRDMMENSGIFVVRATNCAILGGSRRGSGGLPTSSPRVGISNHGANLRSPARSAGPNRPHYGRDVNRRRRDDSLLHKTVTIKSGQWKGYVGIVKECTDTIASVELHTNCKTIAVSKDLLIVAGTNQTYQPEFAPRTPMHSWDSRTPMREDIMATPSRDIMATPLRAPGTPLRIGTAWDPSQPNTPMRDMSDATPENIVATPGSSFQPSSVYSPFSPAPRHSFRDDSEMNPTTPGSTFTPGYDVTPGSTFTPHGYGGRTPQDITTPYSGSTPYQPNTPVTPLTPHTPGTPGAGDVYDQHMEEKSDADASWQTTDIEVNITSGAHKNSKGVIRELLGDSCRVVLESGDTVVIPNHDLEPVVPSHKGNIKIIQGELRGQTGVLIGIDGADGIVKMSSNLDIKILDLHHLAIHQPA